MSLFYSIILIIFIIFLFLGLNFKEKFSNGCNDFFRGKTFCNFDDDQSRCICSFQKNYVKKPFLAPDDCCNNRCEGLEREECNNIDKKLKNYYYCNVNGKCEKLTGDSMSKRLSLNICGLDRLNQSIVSPYISEEQCEKDNNQCKKYNIRERSATYNKNKCLKNDNCGFCYNEYGDGICIEGDRNGPLDRMKYGTQCIVGDNYEYKNTEFFSNKDIYCDVNGKCKKVNEDNCGTDITTNQFNRVYTSLDECKNDIEVCDIYNNNDKSKLENKEDCLKNTSCGYCNDIDNGKCVEGSPVGPNNVRKYYNCIYNLNYEYGDHATFII